MSVKIIDGGANSPLATAVAEMLSVPLTRCIVARFPDGEARIELMDRVAGDDVFIMQPTGLAPDERLIELLLIADAARRNGASRVTAVVPYFGYARQDHDGGKPVAAGVVARMIEAARVDELIALDLHSRAVETAFRIPVRHLSAVDTIAARLAGLLPSNAVVVAPDLGAVKLAERYANALALPVAFVHKERLSGVAVEVRGVTGDVRGRAPVIIDDMISTGGTIAAAAAACIAAGARPELVVAATHALLVGDAGARLAELPLRALLVTDSLPQQHLAHPSLDRVTIAPLLADAVATPRASGPSPGHRVPASQTEEEAYVSR